ncbi:mycofactocin system transcriptional regulator [Leucobacter allii]|uniref:Mycofactocin system transcriptional regulator n=1 Tax=Leucobacter allii TaxID=2932247 RepID=A0ABY4FMM2_9MICO|nr:mycofactocin system transcriptional regulator [Leucobacter allii]UOQ57536.1 mycofactocin system transcriptional regulator [Leucobacter allii]UOR01984.1 mycofactocin system transcriptional regulator [Leucobacter allii]
MDPEPAGTAATAPRIGRAPATTHGELSHIALNLFIERGFDATTMDDIAQRAGIGRRTLFRYFASKNELPWGDFAPLLQAMRARLAGTDPELPLMRALKDAILDFNTFPAEEHAYHRGRMSLLLTVPSLTAYSTLKYADWRAVIAEFVAARTGAAPDDLAPQTIAYACLGMCIGSYERWLADDDADLLALIDEAFVTAESVFGLHAS